MRCPSAHWEGVNAISGAKVSREEMLWPGRILSGGKRKAPKPADCVLRVNGHVLGVLEAKKASKGYTSGVGQAKDYAQRTNARYAYSTTLQSQS